MVIGLGLGSVAGIAEACVATDRDGWAIGFFPLVALILWATPGGALGLAAFSARARAGMPAELGHAAVALRTVLGLTAALAAGRAYLHLADAQPRQLLATTAAIVLAALILWLLTPRLVRPRALRAAFYLLARAAPALGIAAAVGAGGLWLAGGRGDVGRLTRFRPPPPASASAAAVARRLPRLLLIGLDAATWKIVLPLIEDGELPHLNRLIAQGHWGVLRSQSPSFSPVVWTSIMTGKGPELHRVHRSALERRVKPLWQIAKERGLRSAVINVPGSYPVRGDADVMLSGFPLSARANLSSLGWIVTAGPRTPYPKAPIYARLREAKPIHGTTAVHRVELADLPATSRLLEATPLVWLRAAGLEDLATALLRRVAAVRFGELDLSVSQGPAGPTAVGRSGELLFELAPGEWSDWLTVDRGGQRAHFRAHLTTDTPGPTLYVTPLFSAPEPAFVDPLADVAPLLRCPHVPEGAGWLLLYDDRLIASLRDHLLDVGDCLADNAIAVLDRFAADLFIHVFTVTDRMQHGLLKFALPNPYLRLARELGGDYAHFAPTPEQVSRFGDAVAESYRRSDAALGRILQRAGTGTWVIVVSDHGARPGPHTSRPTGGIHDDEGIYVITQWSPDADPRDLRPAQSGELLLEDVTPIALHLLGLPVALDMAGRVPSFLVDLLDSPAQIATYESEGPTPATRVEDDPALREQLRSLGYVE